MWEVVIFCCVVDNEDDFRVLWLEALKDMRDMAIESLRESFDS